MGEPQRPVIIGLVQLLQEILLPFLRPQNDDDPKLPEVKPLLLAGVAAVVGVILCQLPHDGRFAIAVVADLGPLHFEKIVQGVLAVRLRRVGDREHRIRTDCAFQVRLLPVELLCMLVAGVLERNMEERYFKLVVKGSLRVLVKGLGLNPYGIT